MTMNGTMLTRTRAKTILLFSLCAFLLCVQIQAAEESDNALPYPPRTFIYVMDYSGSMDPMQPAIEAGRDMLSALLPEERTIEIKFAEKVLESEDRLDTVRETSVLTGLRAADQTLGKLWSANPEQKVTVLLFSDMHNTVQANDGRTRLTQAYFDEVERPELQELEKKWNEYVRDGKLHFYTLPWLYQLPNEDSERPTYPFDPTHTAYAALSEETLPNSQAEILRACVEAYAQVLTGGSGIEWVELSAVEAEGGLSVLLNESYRTFLFSEQALDNVVGDYSSSELGPWSLNSGANVHLLERTKSGTYLLTNLFGDTKVSALAVPQPRITIDITPKDPMCMESSVSIKVGVKAGREYLDYDGSNSDCMLQISAPSGKTEALTAEYGAGQNYYDFSFIPQEKGCYEVSVLYMSGDDVRSVSEWLEVSAFRVVLKGQARWDYEDLKDKLQKLEKGQTLDIRLADYYSTPYRRLEFMIEGAEENSAAEWDALSGENGEIKITARWEGDATLRYTINYYDISSGALDNSVDYSLKIEVQKAKPNIWSTVGVSAVAIAAVAIVIHHAHSNKREI